ncbi:MAG: uroporphyrinogen decarboxylase/cobalamine-independent methonine synthase family protein [Sedimentisphaerales bacterium]
MSGELNQLNELLNLIEKQIDICHCGSIDERYRAALSYQDVDMPPLVIQSTFGKSWILPEPWNRFEQYPYRQAFDEPAKMMQNMLLNRVVPGLILKDDNPLAIRNDHGTIQIAGLLGGQWHFHDNNYPWVSSLGSTEAIHKLVESDFEIDFNKGVIPQSTKTLEFYHEQLSQRPKCSETIQISLPDIQGPMDTADILWGSEILVEILANPKLVSALLGKIVNVMILAERYYRRFAVDRLDPLANTQHGYNIPGRLLIRNDSSIMVSPETYRQMIKPQDARLLKEIGAGSIHFCGNGRHLIESMLEIPDLRGIDLGQPELMDIKALYSLCSDSKVALTNLTPPREDLISGKAVKDYPTGVVFVYHTENIADALEVIEKYRYSN